MKKFIVGTALVWLVLFRAPLCPAAGFLIYEHGAAAMAMGGAFVAVANDPSAVFHNPAGIAFLKGTQLSVGTTLIASSSSLTLSNYPDPSKREWKQADQLFYPSSFYLTRSLGDKVTVGFGFFSPYGLGAEWPKENPLRYLGYKDDMKTFFFNPAVAVKLTDNLSLGFGVSYIHSTVKFWMVELENFGAYGKYDVPAVLDGSGNAFGFNAGLIYKSEKGSVGINYRSHFNIKYSGELSLDTSLVPAPLQKYVPASDTGSTNFKFPGIFGFGFAINATQKLILSADLHLVTWSRFDKYVVDFSQVPDLEVAQYFSDSFLVRGGAQYAFSRRFSLRAGIVYDQSPQPAATADPLLPDSDRVALTGGFGINLTGNLFLDLAYQYEMFSDRTAPNRYALQVGSTNFGVGTYKTTANLVGISLRYAF